MERWVVVMSKMFPFPDGMPTHPNCRCFLLDDSALDDCHIGFAELLMDPIDKYGGWEVLEL